MTRLLVVEDESNIAQTLRQVLEREGYEVEVVGTARDADRSVATNLPDLVLLDWMLPDESGADLLRRWRQASAPIHAVPVIFVTARVDVVDRIVGLELGADDYINKPFDSRELVARVRARLRSHSTDPVVYEHAGVRMEIETHTVKYRGQEISLTRMEFGLLRLLLEYPGRVFGREELLNRVWGYERTPTTRTVDTHMHELRRKLSPELFESVRGVGYRIRKNVTP